MMQTKTTAQNITNNTIASNQTICASNVPNIIVGSFPLGGIGVYSYLWLKSTTSGTSGFSAATGINNTMSYQPPLQSVNTWYKRVVNSGSYKDTTAAVAIMMWSGTISISPSGTINICQGDSATICATTTDTNLSYQWMFGSISQGLWTPIAAANNHCFTAHSGGDYYLTVTTSNGCSYSSNAVTVNVNTNAVSSIIPTGNYYLCNNATGVLTANVVSGQNYQWYLNGAPISGATGTTYTVTSAGNYQMFVTAGTCQAFSDTTHVISQTAPTANIGAAGNTTFCLGGSALLMANNNPNYQYQWYMGSNPIPGANSYSFNAVSAGNYTVQETYNSCTGTSNSISVVVNPVPVANISLASGSAQICQGDSALLIAGTGVGQTYQWLNSGTPIPGATNPSYFASVGGNYQVVVTNPFNCSTTSTIVNISVVPNPTPNVVVSGDTVKAVGYLLYQWYLNGTAIAGATHSSYTATVSGNYSVSVVTANGCHGTSNAIHITVSSIDDVAADDVFFVSPNPVKNLLTIQYQAEGDLSVMDITGRVLNNYLLKNNGGKSTLVVDLSKLSSGIYLLQYQSSNYLRTIRLLKE
jgi:hypothetical protein